MKYMDDVQTVNEAIEWLRKYQRATIETIDGVFYRVTQDDHAVVECCGVALVSHVNAAQWMRYARKLSSALSRVAGDSVVAELDRVWESCNAE